MPDSPALDVSALVEVVPSAPKPVRVPEVIDPLELEEAAFFDESKHPRWPKGAAFGRGGQFMSLGELITLGGKMWEITHVFGDEVVLENADGKYENVETRVVKATTNKDGVLSLKGAEPAEPRAIQGGKTGSDVTIVDPYVDPSTHDPSIALPKNSGISQEQWLTFGRLDQLNYVDLMERFGQYDPQKAPGLISESYKAYSSAVQKLVRSMYSSQYGSSSGFTLSLTAFWQGVKGKLSGKKGEETWAQRREARSLLAEHAAVVQWDLYNRTHSPDVALFHKDSDHAASWWKSKIIDGKIPAFSALSQSWMYRKSFFGSVCLATPTAIRHVTLSSYSAQPIPGETHFAGEREVALRNQFAADSRSLVFTNSESLITGQSVQNWLEKHTKSPKGGQLVRDIAEAIDGGKKLPIPPEPPDIEMGNGNEPPPNPAPDAPGAMQAFAEFLPGEVGSPIDPADLSKELPFKHTTKGGKPEARVANESGFHAGDFMIGLKGTLYWLGPDPNDSSGFNLRYYKIVPNAKGELEYNGESYLFEGGGKNKYYLLDMNVPPPPIKEADDDVFDPGAYVNGTEESFLSEFSVGDKFKVNGTAYEVTGKHAGQKVGITSLETGVKGTINAGYKSAKLEPKEGYVPATKELGLTPGVRFGMDGTEYVVTSVRKDGTVRAKPAAGGTVISLDEAQQAAQKESGLRFLPSDWTIETSKTKGKEVAVGEWIQAGAGTKYLRPLKVTGKEGKTLKWRALDGTEGEGSLNKSYRRIVPDVPEPELPASATKKQSTTVEDNGHNPSDWVQTDDATALQDGPFGEETVMQTTLDQVLPGQKYVGANGEQHEVISVNDEEMVIKPLTGKYAGSTVVFPLASAPDVPVMPLKVKDGGDHAFDKAKYVEAEAKPIEEFAEGEIFVSPKGTAYKVAKAWTGAKHVKTVNLETGKPYPVQAGKSMTPLVAKAGLAAEGDSSWVSEGDHVALGTVGQGQVVKIPDENGATQALMGTDTFLVDSTSTNETMVFPLDVTDPSYPVKLASQPSNLPNGLAVEFVGDIGFIADPVDPGEIPFSDNKSVMVEEQAPSLISETVQVTAGGVTRKGIVTNMNGPDYEVTFGDGHTEIHPPSAVSQDLNYTEVGDLLPLKQTHLGDIVEVAPAGGTPITGHVVTHASGNKGIVLDPKDPQAKPLFYTDEGQMTLAKVVGKTEVASPPNVGQQAATVFMGQPGVVVDYDPDTLETMIQHSDGSITLAQSKDIDFVGPEAPEDALSLLTDWVTVPLADVSPGTEVKLAKGAPSGTVTVNYGGETSVEYNTHPETAGLTEVFPSEMEALIPEQNDDSAYFAAAEADIEILSASPKLGDKGDDALAGFIDSIGGGLADSGDLILKKKLRMEKLEDGAWRALLYRDDPNDAPASWTVVVNANGTWEIVAYKDFDYEHFQSPDLPPLPDDTVPYKSSYGTGGSVKYLKVSEMDKGDIFTGKGGKSAPQYRVVDPAKGWVSPVGDPDQTFQVPLTGSPVPRWRIVPTN